MLTPWVPDDLWPGLSLERVHGQQFPPVPIIVAGHLDDPRAAECRADRRTLCADRFVIDRIIEFDPAAVPTPGITPSPSPFPWDSPPPPPLDLALCSRVDSAPPPYRFVGWITGKDLGLADDRLFDDEIVYAAVTRDPVPLGTWSKRDNEGRRWRLWGRRACFAREYDEGGAGFGTISGSTHRQYEDDSSAPP